MPHHRRVPVHPCALGVTLIVTMRATRVKAACAVRRAAHAFFAPLGTVGESDVGKELLLGPLLAEWAVARHMSLTRRNWHIADHPPYVAFAEFEDRSGLK